MCSRSTDVRITAHQDRGASVRFDDLAGRHPFQLCAQFVLYLHGGQSGAPDGLCIHGHAQVGHAFSGLGQHVFGTGHPFDGGGHLLRQCVECVQVGAEQLHRQIAAAAGQHFRNPHLDRLGEAEFDAGEVLQHRAQFPAEPFLVGLAPFTLRLELEEHVAFIQAHRIQAQFVRSHPRHDVLHFRYRRQQRLLHRQVQFQRTLQRDRRRLLQLHQDVAFVHGRHETLAGTEIRANADQQDQHRNPECAGWVGEDFFQKWTVYRTHLAHQPRLMVLALLQQQRGQHRHEGKRQQQRSTQRKHHGQRHGCKHLAFQSFQGKQWQEGQADDQHAGGDRFGDFMGGGEHTVQAWKVRTRRIG